MASSNKTNHLYLNQWAANDPVLRVDFNADNARLDSAVNQRALLRLAGGTLSAAQGTISITLVDCDLSQYRQLQVLCAPVVSLGSYTGTLTGPIVQISMNGGTSASILRISYDATTAQVFSTHLSLTPGGIAGYTLSGIGALTPLNGMGSVSVGSVPTLDLSLSDNATFAAGTWYEVYGLKA